MKARNGNVKLPKGLHQLQNEFLAYSYLGCAATLEKGKHFNGIKSPRLKNMNVE
jgi:hypothetical protein